MLKPSGEQHRDLVVLHEWLKPFGVTDICDSVGLFYLIIKILSLLLNKKEGL